MVLVFDMVFSLLTRRGGVSFNRGSAYLFPWIGFERPQFSGSAWLG
jgi:hypothetical protein